MLDVRGPIRPADFYAEDAERWMRAKLDQDAWREGVAMAKAEAAKEKPAATDGDERPQRRSRRAAT